MPREIYDPKKPELEFYNKRQKKSFAHKREVSIFARRWFMFLYGSFLTLLVVGLYLYKKGFFNDMQYFDLLKTQKYVEVKINNLEFYDEEAVIATVEVINYGYTNASGNIDKLKTKMSLYKNKKLIFTGNDSFYKIMFPLGQRIGFKTTFDKNYWNEANNLEILLYFDDDLITTNNINIRKLKNKNK